MANNREEVAKRTLDRLKRFTDQLTSGKPVSDVYQVRNVVLHFVPEAFTSETVKEVRHLLQLSQSLFAKLMNVSTSTVQKWEAGKSEPDGAACRLMDEMRRDPDYWRSRFRGLVEASKKRVLVAAE